MDEKETLRNLISRFTEENFSYNVNVVKQPTADNEQDHTFCRKKYSEENHLSELHRRNERHRHWGLNNVLKEISSKIPGFEEVTRETKIVQLQRIINYICFMENKIEQLRCELNKPCDNQFKSLTEELRKISGSQVSIFSCNKWRTATRRARKYVSLGDSAEAEADVFTSSKGKELRISSPTVDSTSDNFSSMLESDMEINALKTRKLTASDDSDALTRSSFDDDSSDSSYGPLPDFLDMLGELDDKELGQFLLFPDSTANDQQIGLDETINSTTSGELEDIHSYAKHAPESSATSASVENLVGCDTMPGPSCDLDHSEGNPEHLTTILDNKVHPAHDSILETNKNHVTPAKCWNTSSSNLTKIRSDGRRKSWMNGFMMFSRQHRRAFITKHPGMQTAFISKMLGMTWNKMTTEEKEPYREQAQQYREQNMWD